MANIKKIEGYDLVQAELKNTSDENLYLVFYANVDGKKISWCPDCVKADPVLKKHYPKDSKVLLCYVGERSEWRDFDNAFRTDSFFKLTSVPTIINKKTNARLVEAECYDEEKVQAFFS